MICFKDKSYCSSAPEQCTCGGQITQEEIEQAIKMGLPVCYTPFCEETTEVIENE